MVWNWENYKGPNVFQPIFNCQSERKTWCAVPFETFPFVVKRRQKPCGQKISHMHVPVWTILLLKLLKGTKVIILIEHITLDRVVWRWRIHVAAPCWFGCKDWLCWVFVTSSKINKISFCCSKKIGSVEFIFLGKIVTWIAHFHTSNSCSFSICWFKEK